MRSTRQQFLSILTVSLLFSAHASALTVSGMQKLTKAAVVVTCDVAEDNYDATASLSQLCGNSELKAYATFRTILNYLRSHNLYLPDQDKLDSNTISPNEIVDRAKETVLPAR